MSDDAEVITIEARGLIRIVTLGEECEPLTGSGWAGILAVSGNDANTGILGT